MGGKAFAVRESINNVVEQKELTIIFASIFLKIKMM